MIFYRLFLLLVLISVSSCQSNFSIDSKPRPTPPPYFSFPKVMGINENSGIDFVKIPTDQNIVATAVDADDGSVINMGNFNGETLDGQVTSQNDLFLFKADHTGKLIWSIVFNTDHPLINDGTGNESATGIYLDQAQKMVYLIGSTTGALVETNATGNTDIVVAKISTNGSVIWVRQYGHETQETLKTLLARPGLDLSLNDRLGQIKMSPAGKLIASFETVGSIFDTNTGVGTSDAGVIQINPVNGDLEKGMQIGATAVLPWAGDSSKNDLINNSTFDFDGSKIIVPLRTNGSLRDTNANAAADAGYFVVDENLNLERVIQIGTTTYAAWVGAGNYAGLVSGDDQFRSVVVLSEGKYLFYGKSSASFGELFTGSADFIFVKFSNHLLEKINQYGSTTFPTATASDEPRHMIRLTNGKIYCSGHTRSNLFSTNALGLNSPIIFRVNDDGDLIEGYQLGDPERTASGIALNNHILVSSQGFDVTQDKQIRTGFNVSSVSTSGPFTSYLWSIDI